MSPDMHLLLDAVLSVCAVAAFLLGRYAWPSTAGVQAQIDREADAAYDEGWDDALADQRQTLISVDLPGRGTDDIEAAMPATKPRQRSQIEVDLAPAGELLDWRAQYEQLAPATLDAENLEGVMPHSWDVPVEAHMNLPGPVRMPAHGAGEHHYDTMFPRVLHLGQPYDGTELTQTRVELHRMTVWNAVEAARRALLVECGVPWVPMEAIAA